MTATAQPTTGEDPRPAGPFTPGDPLSYEELSPEGRAWRAVLHLLATTGTSLRLPTVMAPMSVTVAIAAGWRYHWEMLADAARPEPPEGQMVLRAWFTGWPEPRPEEDPHAHGARVYAHLKATNDPTARPGTCCGCGRNVLFAAATDSNGAPTVMLDPAPVALCGAPVTSMRPEGGCSLAAGHKIICADGRPAEARDLAALVASQEGSLTAVYGVPYAGDPDLGVLADAPRYRQHTCPRHASPPGEGANP